MKFFSNNNLFKRNFFKKGGFDLGQCFYNYKNIISLTDIPYNHYVYSFFVKKTFYKLEFKNKKLDNYSNFFKWSFKKKSSSSSFLQNCLNGGNKLKMMRYINIMRFNFYFFFSKKFDFFQKKFPTYNIFYNFSKTEKKFFDLNFIFNLILKNNESIFCTKVVRLNKKIKQKNKTKSKYSVDAQYLKNNKRNYFTLKQIHLYSNNYNFYKYNERLLMSFFNVFFLEKNSEIYKNKIMTYQNILKKNTK